MPIRENASSNIAISEKTYLTVYIDGEVDGTLIRRKLQDDFLISEHTNNRFLLELQFKRKARFFN